MTKILVLHCSASGHIETKAGAVAEGGRFQCRHAAQIAARPARAA